MFGPRRRREGWHFGGLCCGQAFKDVVEIFGRIEAVAAATSQLQARGGAAGGPVIKGFAARPTAGPQITLFGFSVAWLQVIDRRFIHLHIPVGQHACGWLDVPQSD